MKNTKSENDATTTGILKLIPKIKNEKIVDLRNIVLGKRDKSRFFSFPQTETIAIKLKTVIEQLKKDLSKNDFYDTFYYLINQKYYDTGKVVIDNTYMALQNKATILNLHIYIAYVYNVYGYKHLKLVTEQHSNKKFWYVSIFVEQGYTTHHIKQAIGNEIRNVANNLMIIPTHIHDILKGNETRQDIIKLIEG